MHSPRSRSRRAFSGPKPCSTATQATGPARSAVRARGVLRQHSPPRCSVLQFRLRPTFSPAVEEFFFRGFLFNAIYTATRARTAILATAALFGLFHVFMSGILTIERFLPTALMGLVLGWLRWCSRSVFPGMLLHALHNGLLLSLALFP